MMWVLRPCSPFSVGPLDRETRINGILEIMHCSRGVNLVALILHALRVLVTAH